MTPPNGLLTTGTFENFASSYPLAVLPGLSACHLSASGSVATASGTTPRMKAHAVDTVILNSRDRVQSSEGVTLLLTKGRAIYHLGGPINTEAASGQGSMGVAAPRGGIVMRQEKRFGKRIAEPSAVQIIRELRLMALRQLLDAAIAREAAAAEGGLRAHATPSTSNDL